MVPVGAVADPCRKARRHQGEQPFERIRSRLLQRRLPGRGKLGRDVTKRLRQQRILRFEMKQQVGLRHTRFARDGCQRRLGETDAGDRIDGCGDDVLPSRILGDPFGSGSQNRPQGVPVNDCCQVFMVINRDGTPYQGITVQGFAQIIHFN